MFKTESINKAILKLGAKLTNESQLTTITVLGLIPLYLLLYIWIMVRNIKAEPITIIGILKTLITLFFMFGSLMITLGVMVDETITHKIKLGNRLTKYLDRL